MESGEGYSSGTATRRVEVTLDRTGETPQVVLSDSEHESAWLSMDESSACNLSRWQ